MIDPNNKYTEFDNENDTINKESTQENEQKQGIQFENIQTDSLTTQNQRKGCKKIIKSIGMKIVFTIFMIFYLILPTIQSYYFFYCLFTTEEYFTGETIIIMIYFLFNIIAYFPKYYETQAQTLFHIVLKVLQVDQFYITMQKKKKLDNIQLDKIEKTIFYFTVILSIYFEYFTNFILKKFFPVFLRFMIYSMLEQQVKFNPILEIDNEDTYWICNHYFFTSLFHFLVFYTMVLFTFPSLLFYLAFIGLVVAICTCKNKEDKNFAYELFYFRSPIDFNVEYAFQNKLSYKGNQSLKTSQEYYIVLVFFNIIAFIVRLFLDLPLSGLMIQFRILLLLLSIVSMLLLIKRYKQAKHIIDNSKYFDEIKKIKLQLLLYNKFIRDEQVYNPMIIFYDLYI